MKKLFALLLAMVMVFSLATTAFAVKNVTNGEEVYSASVTINNATSSYKYKIYKLLHLDTYNNENGAYIYTVEEKWEDFFTDYAEAPEKDALDYVSIDPITGHVSWIAGQEDAAAFAALALDYAVANGIAPEAESAEGNFTGTACKFTGLTYGYYLVDTSMGALCGLNTTMPDATISVKNGVPTIDKKVQEDSSVNDATGGYGSSNSADIGQTVNFDTEILIQAGADSYIYHDKMSDGLTFNAGSVKVYYNDTTIPGEAGYRQLTAGDEYTLHVGSCEDKKCFDGGCTFYVVFDQSFLSDETKANDKINIRYSATLNEDAVVTEDGNPNSAILEYGDEHFTNSDSTTTYTYGFEIVKTDAAQKPLIGAEFELYSSSELIHANLIHVKYDEALKCYIRVESVEEHEEGSGTYDRIVVTNTNGVVRVVGLDNGIYYLKEVKAPDGYQPMVGSKQFTISGSNLYTLDGAINAAVHVVNNRGIALPDTGATGTVMFITFGMFAVLATGVLLVTKKRMSMIED